MMNSSHVTLNTSLNPTNSNTITKEEENRMRIRYLLDKGKNELLNIFHQSFQRNPTDLYNELSRHRTQLNQLKQKGPLSMSEWSLLFPGSKRTDSSLFDTTLLMFLLRTLCRLPEPVTKCGKRPSSADRSTSAQVVEITLVRNELSHSYLSLDDVKFKALYRRLKKAMMILGCSKVDIKTVKTVGIDLTDRSLLVEAIKETKDLQKRIAHLENCIEGVWWNMHSYVDKFAGRDIEIQELHDLLTSVHYNQHGIAITGYGGIGKTEIALFYCHQMCEEYKGNVLWINADDYDSIENSFFSLARYLKLSVVDVHGKQLGAKAITQKVYEFFANRKSLFVFDNAMNEKTISEYFPTSIPPGTIKPVILITSQFTQWSGNIQKYNLNVLSRDCAFKFVEDHVPNNLYNADAAKNLLDKIERLSMALQLSLSFILKHRITIKEFNKMFEESSEYFLNKKFNSVYDKTISAAFHMVLEQLKKNGNILAQTIIELMAYMDGRQLEQDIFFHMDSYSKLEILEAFDVIGEYSLTRQIYFTDWEGNQKVAFSMHALIQEVVVYQLADNSQISNIENHKLCTIKYIISLLDQIKAKHANKYHYTFGEQWLHHLLTITDRYTNSTSIMQVMISQRDDVFIALKNSGKFDQVLHYLQCYYDYVVKCCDPNDPKIKELMFCKVSCLQDQGKLSDALVILEELERNWYKDAGEIDLNFHDLKSLSLMEQGHTSNALLILTDLHTMATNAFGVRHEITLEYLEKIGRCLMKKRELRAALEIFQEVCNFRKDHRGDLHPDTLCVQNYIAMCLGELSNPSGSLILCEELLPKMKDIFGDKHPNTLGLKNQIGLCQLDQGNVLTALEIFKEVNMMQKEVLGPMHKDTLNTQSNIGKCLLNLNLFQEALELYKELNENENQVLGLYHPNTLSSYLSIGECLCNLKELDKAFDIVKYVYEQRKSLLGELHPDTINCQAELSERLYELKRYRKALNVSKDVYLKSKDVNGANHLDTLRSQNQIGVCLLELGDTSAALKEFEAVEKKFRNLLGNKHPSTLIVQRNVATCLRKDNLRAAITTFEELLPKMEEVLGELDKTTIAVMREYGESLRDKGCLPAAVRVLKKVHSNLKQVYGELSPITLTFYLEVGDCLLRQGNNIGEAFEVFYEVSVMSQQEFGASNQLTIRSKQYVLICMLCVADMVRIYTTSIEK